MIRRSAVLLGALLLGGCASSPPSVPNKDVPKWLVEAPSDVFGRRCAVGRSSATFYRKTGLRNAEASARVALAEAEAVHVKSMMVDVQRSDARKAVSQGSGNSIVQVSELKQETVVENSDIVTTWFDQFGNAPSGEKGATYAVACFR